MSEELVLKDLGTHNWKEVSSILDPKPVGMHLAKLHKDMWSEQGYSLERSEEKHGRVYRIIYDKEYVAEFIHSRIYEPLGIILPNGSFNLPLREEVMLFTDTYSQSAAERESEAELNSQASALSQRYGVPFEKAKAVLIENNRRLREALELEEPLITTKAK